MGLRREVSRPGSSSCGYSQHSTFPPACEATRHCLSSLTIRYAQWSSGLACLLYRAGHRTSTPEKEHLVLETCPTYERALYRWKVSVVSPPLHLDIWSKADEIPPPNSQHFLFSVFSFISCAVSIGYFASFHQVYIDGTHQDEAFYWRTLIWVVYGVHLWTASSSNLQAGILSSQTAARKNLLSPLFMNILFLSVLFGMLLSCVVSLQSRRG